MKNKKVCHAVKTYIKSSKEDGSHEKLTSEQKLLVKTLMIDFEDQGCSRSDEINKKLKKLDDRVKEIKEK